MFYQLFASAIICFSVLTSTMTHARSLPDRTQFGIAMEMGDVSKAKRWLDAGLDPEFLADRVGTGLMLGAWEGNIAMMEVFYSKGANLNQVNKVGEQAIMHAAWKGHLGAVQWLVERGAEVNRVSPLEWSAIHYAAFNGHREIVDYLLSKGANINARSTNGSTALMMAIREGHHDLVSHFMKLGARTDIVNDWGDNALTWAMRTRDEQMVKAITSPSEYANIMKLPKSEWGKEMPKSVPATPEIEAILRNSREAMANGQSTASYDAQLKAALAKLGKEKPIPVAKTPQNKTEPAQPPSTIAKPEKVVPSMTPAMVDTPIGQKLVSNIVFAERSGMSIQAKRKRKDGDSKQERVRIQ